EMVYVAGLGGLRRPERRDGLRRRPRAEFRRRRCSRGRLRLGASPTSATTGTTCAATSSPPTSPRKAQGCLLEPRRYGQPPHVAGTDSLRAILHWPPPLASEVVPGRFATVTMIGTRSPLSMGARMTTDSRAGIRKSNRRWQSDVIVDLVKRYGFPYVELNPGASFRGLHDSLVNYGENDPPMLLCNHEKIA